MRGVDPLLWQPIRLVILAALVTDDVYLTGHIGDALGVPRVVLISHVRRLRDAEYVRTFQGAYSKQWLQRTPAGRTRFVEHVAALRALLDAGENVGRGVPPDAVHRVHTE